MKRKDVDYSSMSTSRKRQAPGSVPAPPAAPAEGASAARRASQAPAWFGAAADDDMKSRPPAGAAGSVELQGRRPGPWGDFERKEAAPFPPDDNPA
jgi:hypothetical protein